jgi:hypothetical protein
MAVGVEALARDAERLRAFSRPSRRPARRGIFARLVRAIVGN